MKEVSAEFMLIVRCLVLGPWMKGKKHGQGTINYANGDTYQGMLDNGEISGKGKYIYSKKK